MSAINEKIQSQIAEFVRKHRLACEGLTENQVAEVIGQALACGDIIKNVRVTDNAQCVVYIPFAETERLRTRIRDLKELLKQHGISEPEHWGADFCQ